MSPLEFLGFEDWILAREFEDKSWIVVARSVNSGDTDLFTTSMLAKTNSEDELKRTLSSSDWIAFLDFGHPTFYREGSDKQILFDLGRTKQIDGILYEPFTLFQEFHGLAPSRFDVVQSFLLYHNLFFVEQESVFRKVDQDGEESDVIRIKDHNDQQEIRVATGFLRDYLAARQTVLVRQHDHRRFARDSLKPFLGDKKHEEYNHHSPTSHNYTVCVANEPLVSKWESFSRLLGKDIVRPFEKPVSSHLWFSDEWKARKQFSKFVIDLDDENNVIEETCSEDELSNVFVDMGKPHFLTPVFFKREVLKKYYDNPSKYSVSSRHLGCLDLWGLPIDINPKGLVQVWLGDLGRIPHREQQHWRLYNVPPEGGISEHRLKTDFLAEFADSSEPIFRFQRAYNQAQKRFHSAFGFNLFMDLSKEDSHCFDTLHVPVTNEQKELDEQILNLEKVLSESLDKRSLDDKASNSLSALRNFLSSRIGSEEAHKLTEPFKMIHNLRSSGAAHRKGKKFERHLRRHGLEGLSNQDKFLAILNEVEGSLKKLSAI